MNILIENSIFSSLAVDMLDDYIKSGKDEKFIIHTDKQNTNGILYDVKMNSESFEKDYDTFFLEKLVFSLYGSKVLFLDNGIPRNLDSLKHFFLLSYNNILISKLIPNLTDLDGNLKSIFFNDWKGYIRSIENGLGIGFLSNSDIKEVRIPLENLFPSIGCRVDIFCHVRKNFPNKHHLARTLRTWKGDSELFYISPEGLKLNFGQSTTQ